MDFRSTAVCQNAYSKCDFVKGTLCMLVFFTVCTNENTKTQRQGSTFLQVNTTSLLQWLKTAGTQGNDW